MNHKRNDLVHIWLKAWNQAIDYILQSYYGIVVLSGSCKEKKTHFHPFEKHTKGMCSHMVESIHWLLNDTVMG